MSKSPFQEHFYKLLPGAPTTDQTDLVERMERFLFSDVERIGFIIRGYAGTGKTTAIAAMVKTFPRFRLKSVLLAPTGRAAKVLGAFSKKKAFTIHKKIYQTKRGKNGGLQMFLTKNLHTNTLFIVDEASMISAGANQLRSLLDDLIEYVYGGKNCKLIFIGDIAQLPPVGSSLSPALHPAYLKTNFNLQLKGVELKQVVRQADSSGILFNATQLRFQALEEKPLIKFFLQNFEDVKRINGLELEEELEGAYSNFGEEETMIICRSNKRAFQFNQQVRTRIKGVEEEIETGDLIMVVKNNYFWLEEENPIGFIANGDVARIERCGSVESKHGFKFLNASVKLVDYPEQEALEVKLLLESIYAEAPALTKVDNDKLYNNLQLEYSNVANKQHRMQLIKNDPYFNALQVKFAYAVTCHKSQGGQWKAVFVDQGYLTEEMIDKEYARWLYTAVSRATEKLFLVNFADHFFD